MQLVDEVNAFGETLANVGEEGRRPVGMTCYGDVVLSG